jgi:DnaJ domain
MSETRQDRMYYARCSCSTRKWFWIAKLEEELFTGGDPFAFGCAPTSEEAEQQALEACKGKAPDSKCIKLQNYFASSFKRCLVAKEKSMIESASSTAVPQEFLFVDRYGDSGPDYSSPYLILKKTKKRVYVLREQSSHRCGDWRDYACQRTVVLDRSKLERDGEAYCRPMREVFYTRPMEERRRKYVPECGTLLGLTPPWNVDQVKDAFRKRALEAHPDRGGSAEAFKALWAAYSTALETAS